MGYTTEFEGHFNLDKKLTPVLSSQDQDQDRTVLGFPARVKWRGESFDDIGIIEVRHNDIFVKDVNW
jgi:hypothetical protein